MNLTQQELDKITRAGLTLEEAFYLWSLAIGSPLQIKLPYSSFEKLSKLGFLYQGEISTEGISFFIDPPKVEVKRFDEFFSLFPIDENDGSFVKVANPRPIRIKRAATEVLYTKLVSEGVEEEEIIRTVKRYLDKLRMKPKVGETTFKYCQTPYKFLLQYDQHKDPSTNNFYYRKGIPKNDKNQ